ncbi:hypothetical protein HHI36_021037 [Cryptolaemus montrouzieri]|uniref:LisH domain-containing protein n=1 Tax=Cryptolaemus montrouzieri TaxID=559131 RepID=A0ABD2MW16_9CUCU
MIIAVSKNRTEELFCIFNTIAVFLEHQNFPKTCAVFKKECESKGLSKEGNDHVEEVGDLDEKRQESCERKETNSSFKLSEEEKKSVQITYFFENNSREVCETVSNCGTNTVSLQDVRSRVSVQDYLDLKEKFIDLRDKHKMLLDELEEKTRYLDYVIPLLQQNGFENGQKCPEYTSRKSNAKIPDYPVENTSHDVDNKLSNSDLDTDIIKESILKSKEDEMQQTLEMEPSASLERIVPTPKNAVAQTSPAENSSSSSQNMKQASFLFARKKCLQIRSAPNASGNGRRAPISLSMPLSPLSNNRYFPLDFVKLKEQLLNGRTEYKLLLLQALRWRLTKCTSVERSGILVSYIRNDLLNLRGGKNVLNSLLQDCEEERLLEAMSRFINVLASLKQGRDYLCSSEEVVKVYLVPKVQKLLENSKISTSLEMLVDIFMPYVSGALYSVLSERAVREEALRQGMDVKILQLMKNSDDKYLKKQLEFIVRSRFGGESAKFKCNDNEPPEEIDILEPELDQNDSLNGDTQGESVLETFREVRDRESQNSLRSMGSVGNDNRENKNRNQEKKSPTSRVKFDAESSTDYLDSTMNKMAAESLIKYRKNFPSESLPETMCGCLRPANYKCDCYEAIRQSVEDDDLIFPNEDGVSNKEAKQNVQHSSLFSRPEDSTSFGKSPCKES